MLLRRALQWPDERSPAPGRVEDIHDSPLWQLFQDDPVMHSRMDDKDCPLLPLALAFCGDGVEAYRGHHKKPHSVFCNVAAVLNLPPWARTKMASSLLAFIAPGPHEPKDLQSILDILTDELVFLHEIGFHAMDSSR